MAAHAEHSEAPVVDLPPGVILAPGDTEQTFLESIYFPEIVKGLGNTFKHFFHKSFTIDYDGTDKKNPDKFHIPRAGYRGEHYLKKDEAGHVKCVACFMCAAACPAECIHIEAEATPVEWENRERAPKRFEIDLMRCIYCGMCEQACPCDAIELTQLFDLTGLSRQEMMFDKEKLLSVFDKTVADGTDPVRTHRGPLSISSEPNV